MKLFKRVLPPVLGVAVLLLAVGVSVAFRAEQGAHPEAVSSEPVVQRPAWVKEGTAWAAFTEPLTFLLRRGGDSVDAAKKWGADFTEETIRKVKQDGANAVVVNLHKGFGLKAEAADIEAARKFVQLVHRHGMKAVGYIGGSIMYETLVAEEPEAGDWKMVDQWGQPIYYNLEETYRHMPCRNNPGYQAFLQKVLRVGIQDMKLDGVHFDNFAAVNEPNACRCKYCRAQFQEFLRQRYADDQLRARFGFTRLDYIAPPPYSQDTRGPFTFVPVRNPLMQDWARFRATSLAKRLGEYDNYVHKLNPEAMLRINLSSWWPDANGGFFRAIDLEQLLQHGDMFTSEEANSPHWTPDGRLVSKIRTFKAARIMNKAVWFWEETTKYTQRRNEGPPVLRFAETMAYNDMCLGVITGRDIYPELLTPAVRRYIDFFWQHANDLKHTAPVADVAILRSFASTQFNPAKSNLSTVLFEQTLIQSKIPFAIIFDRHLKDLNKYKVLVLANQDALSDEQVSEIRRFVENGGGLVATEDTSLLTDWRLVRDRFGLADVFGFDQPPAGNQANQPIQRTFGKGRVAYISRIEPSTPPPAPNPVYHIPNRYWTLPKNHVDLAAAVKWAAGDQLAVSVVAPLWVTMELARQPSTNTLLLHLLNFKTTEPLQKVAAQVRVPDGFKVREAVLETPDGEGSQALKVVANGQTVSFQVPSLKVYDLVLLRMEKK